MDLTKRDNLVSGQEVTPLVVGAVQPEGVELAAYVAAVPETLRAAPTCVEPRVDDVADPPRPLALHSQERRPEIQNEVLALVVEGTQDTEAVLNSARSDLRLGECSPLVRRQHRQHSTCNVGRTVARAGDRSA
jgi:hypothetical protein